MSKEYKADELVFANLESNFKGQKRKTEKYLFIEKYSKILDMPIYKGFLTKKKYVNHIYAHYADDFYLTNIEKYTTYFPEDCGKKLDETTILMKTKEFKNRDINTKKNKQFVEESEKQIIKPMKKKQKKYVNKAVLKYKRELNILTEGKIDTLIKTPLLKLSLFVMLSCLSYIIVNTTFMHSIPIPISILISTAVAGTVDIFTFKVINYSYQKNKGIYRYAELPIEKQQEYNEIINKAKELNKIYSSRKLKRFLKVYEIKQVENEANQEVLNYCVSMNEEIRKKDSKNNKIKVIGTLSQEKENILNIQLSRDELETLLNGKMVMVNAKEPIKVSMREDIYSLLDKNPEALKESSRKNKSMIKKRGGIK